MAGPVDWLVDKQFWVSSNLLLCECFGFLSGYLKRQRRASITLISRIQRQGAPKVITYVEFHEVQF